MTKAFNMMTTKDWEGLLSRNWPNFVTEEHFLQYLKRLLLAVYAVLNMTIKE